MSTRTFRFTKTFQKIYKKDYEPSRFFTIEDEFRAQMLKQGYLVMNVEVKWVMMTTCKAARANVSLRHRRAMQAEIDALKDPVDRVYYHPSLKKKRG